LTSSNYLSSLANVFTALLQQVVDIAMSSSLAVLFAQVWWCLCHMRVL
jgi:hypothetical protein